MNDYKIQNIDYSSIKEDDLAYSNPCRGLWNIVNIATQVPSSHQIFVCPTSCLRGVVLTTAEMNAMDQMSTIAVEEEDILEGTMEETMLNGIRKIIDYLLQRPRMIIIFVSCIHHFLSVDYPYVYRTLRHEYPDIDFTEAYMDPIMRKTTPPIPSLTRQIYRVLQKKEKKLKQVNYIGNWISSVPYNDLSDYLIEKGYIIHELADITDYDSFLDMQHSMYNFTFHRYANLAGKDLQLRTGQKWFRIEPSFQYDIIDCQLKKIAQSLSLEMISETRISERRRMTESVIEDVQKEIKDTPIVIDYTAVDDPISLAIFLLEHHFNVETLDIDQIKESKEVFERLKKLKPDLEIRPCDSWKMRVFDREDSRKVLAIGQKAAYYHSSLYFMNMIFTNGMFGYAGICQFMKSMLEAYREPKNLEKLVQIKGLGCHIK